MGEKLQMRMARADEEQIEKMRDWLQKLIEIMDDPQKDAQDIGDYVVQTFEPQRIGEYERILFGYETLVENCCDKSLSYLEFKPEILQALKAASPKWIPVADKLPLLNVHKSVLVIVQEWGNIPSMVIAYAGRSILPGQPVQWMLDETVYILERPTIIADEVTHWLEIPEYPDICKSRIVKGRTK